MLKHDITREKKRKYHNTKKGCYTCILPKGVVRNHMIKQTEFASFHYDMWARPFFIVTPNYHYHTLFEMTPTAQARLWSEIQTFLQEMGFTDFQCLFNNGNWQTHHHLHIKIKVDEVTILNMRKKHLRTTDIKTYT